MTSDLAQQRCVPCEVGGTPLSAGEVEKLQPQIDHRWRVKDHLRLFRDFKFKNFVEAMRFVNRVADLAEAEGHHPDFHIHYHRVTLELWTHAVGGLSVNDFILAAKTDELLAA